MESHQKSQATKATCTIRKSDGNWAKNDKDKAATFATHLEKVFQPVAAEITPVNKEFIHQYLEQPCQSTSPIQPFTMDEII